MENEIARLVIGPLSGAVFAVIVNKIFDIRNKLPKVVFGIRYTHDVSPNSKGIKTNPSGYELYCVNIGQVPVFINKVVFYNKNYKKDYFNEVYRNMEDELSTVMPFTPVIFSLTNQEYNNIYHFCKKKKKYKCKVIAYGVGNKNYKGEVDVWWIKTQDDSLPDNDL